MTEPIYTIFFSSRNKDNKDLEGFKPRTHTFLSKYANHIKLDPNISHQFDEFVKQGVNGELSRCYVSINAADPVKVNNSLMHYLIDHSTATPLQVQNKLISFANQPQNLATHRWLLDCDTSNHVRWLEILYWIKNHNIPIKEYTPTGDPIVYDIFDPNGNQVTSYLTENALTSEEAVREFIKNLPGKDD